MVPVDYSDGDVVVTQVVTLHTFSVISPLDFASVAGHSSVLSATGNIEHPDTAKA